MKEIKEISALETFSVRHPVLRSGKTRESCRFEGDNLATTMHYGLFTPLGMVGVISLFENSNSLFSTGKQFQIRGMAVLAEEQKKGCGEVLVRHIETILIAEKEKIIWFNAREIAVGFYEKLGYQVIGASFNIGDIGKHFVMFKKG